MTKPAVSSGLRRLILATGYSWLGLKAAWQHERAFREEAVALIVLVPLALWLGAGALQKAALIGAWLLVLLTELLNSAIEAAIDRIGAERHELSGRAKDLGSAAVFIALVIAALVWGAAAWERLAAVW